MEHISKQAVASRWTPQLTAKGWSPVANSFLDYYARLVPAITYGEAMVVVHIMRHKWDEKCPYPSLKSIAAKMGVSDQSVRSKVRALDGKGYLGRFYHKGERTRYDMTPLFTALEAAVQAAEKAA